MLNRLVMFKVNVLVNSLCVSNFQSVHVRLKAISYPESSGFLVSGWLPGETLG